MNNRTAMIFAVINILIGIVFAGEAVTIGVLMHKVDHFVHHVEPRDLPEGWTPLSKQN